jgi:hypothetical protein
MEKTIPHPYLGKEFIGYVLNTAFAEEGQEAIIKLQREFSEYFGGAVYVPHPDTLHITLMDWLAPLVDYGRNKDDIFKEIHEEYDVVLRQSIKGVSPISVDFNQIGVSAEAIILIGQDKGQYQEIRSRFLGKVTLLPNTKMPPQIIHTTIVRYADAVDLQPVKDFAAKQTISFPHTTDAFRLLRTTDTSMEAKELIKTYQLL